MRGLLLLAAVCSFTSGCATVISGREAEVSFLTDPPGADVTVRNEKGTIVAKTTTPGSVKLRRGRTWGRPAKYLARFDKPGYQPTEAEIPSKLNPWVLGNLALGGGLGAGVDLATGAMWRPKESTIERGLAAAPTLPQPPIAADDTFTDHAVTPASATSEPR